MQNGGGLAVIVMGVSGCGKSSLGEKLATHGGKFIDGDDLHPRANILKMAGGGALDDDDRAPWYHMSQYVSIANSNRLFVMQPWYEP